MNRSFRLILRGLPGAPALLLAVFLSGAPRQNPKLETDSREQWRALADALRHGSYPLVLHAGKLTGPGMEFLARKSDQAQFVLFGEEHYVKEFPEFLSALFVFLHEKRNFNYLALESDPVSAHVSSLPPLRGNLKVLGEYARRYPNAFTFPTDQELQLIATAGKVSTTRADPVWGLDQSFGVLHALDRLAMLPAARATPKFQELHKQAETQDLRRPNGDQRDYMESVNLSDLEALRDQTAAPEGSEARFILDNLVSSSEIYGYYQRAQTGELTGYANGFEREQLMKRLFLREYRAAEAQGERHPKVLIKMGHWHIYRGVGPSHLQTLGNFATEFAFANGCDAFTVAVFLRGSWRDVSHQEGMVPIAMATDPAAWTVLDFSALRPAVGAGKFGALEAHLLSYVYGFDAALVIGNATEGTESFLNQESE